MKKIALLLIMIFGAASSLPAQKIQPHGTVVIPTLDSHVDAGLNVVYTPAFRISWTSLADEIIHDHVKLRKKTVIADLLNADPYIDRSASEWLAFAGFIEKGIIDEVDRKVSEKYGKPAPGLDDIRGEKEGILCYSYLSFEALFKVPFQKLTWEFKGNSTSLVDCFGVSKGPNDNLRNMRSQVKIVDYRHPDDFIIILNPSDNDYEIIIAETVREKTITEAIAEIDYRISTSFPDDLSDDDELIIPMVRTDIHYSFYELIGKHLANRGFEEYFFAAATSSLDFSLNQSGAYAEATGKIVLKKGPVPRIYAIDKPFIIIIRRPGSSEPDIVIRVENSDLLAPSQKNGVTL